MLAKSAPDAFAASFCEAAALGVKWNDAMGYAFNESYISSLPTPPVASNGYKLDTNLATLTMARLCPKARRAA